MTASLQQSVTHHVGSSSTRAEAQEVSSGLSDYLKVDQHLADDHAVQFCKFPLHRFDKPRRALSRHPGIAPCSVELCEAAKTLPAECKRPDGNALNGQSIPTHIVPGRLRPRIRRPTLADPLRRTLNDRVLPFFENSTASCAVPGADGSRQPRASHELDLA